MGLTLGRDEYTGRVRALRYETERRYAWIGLSGIGFGDGCITYHAHWHDLRHPLKRYAHGPTGLAFFWTQLRRGLITFVLGARLGATEDYNYEEED